MDKIIYAYTAGIVDGEGTVTLSRIDGNKSPWRRPVVTVSSTTRELLEYLQLHFGGTICKQKTYQDHHKQSWSWRVSYAKAERLLRCILPYMIEPEKIRRAHMILNYYKALTTCNGNYSEEEKELKRAFERCFFDAEEELPAVLLAKSYNLYS